MTDAPPQSVLNRPTIISTTAMTQQAAAAPATPPMQQPAAALASAAPPMQQSAAALASAAPPMQQAAAALASAAPPMQQSAAAPATAPAPAPSYASSVQSSSAVRDQASLSLRATLEKRTVYTTIYMGGFSRAIIVHRAEQLFNVARQHVGAQNIQSLVHTSRGRWTMVLASEEVADRLRGKTINIPGQKTPPTFVSKAPASMLVTLYAEDHVASCDIRDRFEAYGTVRRVDFGAYEFANRRLRDGRRLIFITPKVPLAAFPTHISIAGKDYDLFYEGKVSMCRACRKRHTREDACEQRRAYMEKEQTLDEMEVVDMEEGSDQEEGSSEVGRKIEQGGERENENVAQDVAVAAEEKAAKEDRAKTPVKNVGDATTGKVRSRPADVDGSQVVRRNRKTTPTRKGRRGGNGTVTNIPRPNATPRDGRPNAAPKAGRLRDDDDDDSEGLVIDEDFPALEKEKKKRQKSPPTPHRGVKVRPAKQ